MIDCFKILKTDHPRFVDEFRAWKDRPADQVIDGLRARFFVAEFRPAGLREKDVVLWRDPNGRLHLSVFRENLFHIIGRDGQVRHLPLTISSRQAPMRPVCIVRER